MIIHCQTVVNFFMRYTKYMHRGGLILVIAILAACIGLILFTSDPVSAPGPTDMPGTSKQEQAPLADRVMSVKNYVRDNISQLSTEKEELGGTFYVTDISVSANSGVVKYEDGHNAFVADFTFVIDDRGNVDLQTFVVRR